MKKAVLLLFLGLFPFGSYAQFVITPNNFINLKDSAQNYIVVEYPGVSKHELFENGKIYITSKFKGIKYDGYNEVENELIVLDLTIDTSMLLFGTLELVELHDRIELRFKNNKVRIKPFFQDLSIPYRGGSHKILLTGGGLFDPSIFKKNGKPYKETPQIINTLTNRFINNLKIKLDSKEDNW